MQVWSSNKWRKCCSLKLDRSLDRIISIENYCWSSTQAVSVKNYEIRNFRSDYTYILEYLCRVSFLTTLDIYKNYFKSRHEWCKGCNFFFTCIVWPKTEIALIHHTLCRSYCVLTPRVLWPRSSLIFTVDELKNFAANNLPQVGVLVTYWDSCIIS